MTRTGLQNKSLHKWCEQLAIALDDSGHDMRELIRVPIRPNKDNVKAEIVHPVMMAINPKLTSTAQMSTTEIQEVYETLNRALGEKLGIHVPWPCDETLSRR